MNRVVRTFMLSVLALVAILALAAAALFWRLQEGAIEIGFLRPHVERAMNEALAAQGARVRMGGIVLETDARTRLPTLRIRDVALLDAQGNLLASAPRAAVSMNLRDLLLGKPRVRFLELIGPSLKIERTQEGELRIGLMAVRQGAARREMPLPESGQVVRQDRGATTSPAQAGQGIGDLLRALENMSGRMGDGRDGLEGIRISRAAITFHDRRMNRLWHAPAADLVLRRVPYGYTMLATAEVSSEEVRWQVQVNASYRRKAQRLHMTVNLDEVMLSDLAGTLALERLASARLPLSGAVELVFDTSGKMLSASGELHVGAGRLAFPEIIARPLQVREGLLRLDYDPAADMMRITTGYLVLSDTRVELSGSLRPVRDTAGAIVAHDYALQLRHMPLRRRSMQLLIRRIDARGRAWVREARLDIADLVMQGVGGALRLRGSLIQEEAGVALQLAGRGRDIDHRLVMALWPPAVAKGARSWLMENLKDGRIPEGTFRLAIPARVLRAAIVDDVPMPDNVAEVRFKVRDAVFTHVDGWPAVEGASGEAVMTGNNFRLKMTVGRARLPSGKVLKLEEGRLHITDLAAKVSPATLDIRAQGPAEGFMELLQLPPHRLLQELDLPDGEIKGAGRVSLRLAMPLSRKMQGRDVRIVHGSGSVEKGVLRGFVGGVELTQAKLNFSYEKKVLRLSGKGRMNGLSVELSWQQRFLDRGTQAGPLVLRTVLDDKARRRLGVDLSQWMSGSVPLKVEIDARRGKVLGLKVQADLSRVVLRFDAIDWQRAPRKGTVATFAIGLDDPGFVDVKKLDVKGPGGLRVMGKLRLTRDGGFREATFSRFELDANNRLALAIEQGKNGLQVAAAGPVFDARPFIRRMFAREVKRQDLGQPIFVKVNIERLLMERGESIYKVRGELQLQGGYLVRADLRGVFASGKEVVMQMLPAGNGLRRLRIVSRDAGALLRASGLYSRIVGGRAEFTAVLRRGRDSGVQKGLLVLRKFTVRNDKRLARLQQKGRKGKRGPRRALRFSRLVLPFSTDEHFIRIGNAIIQSPEIGATANGMIRRADGAMDIGGTIIPAYALNAAIGNVPIIGQILTGGTGQGIFGLNYALKGTINKPKFIVNPLSAVAPGIFRHLFHVGGHNVNPDGTPRRPGQQQRQRPRSRTNIVNGG